MPPDTAELRSYLWDFDFPGLFVEGLGWNYHQAESACVEVNGCDYSLKPVAEKAEFVVYQCDSGIDGNIPPYPVRRRIERAVAERTFEHMIVFADAGRRAQVWQWVKRESGKTVACREYSVNAGQSGDHVLQRLQRLAFDIEEEAGLTIPIVTSRVRAAMDVEKVTRRFYERFRRELTAFGNFIDGITTQVDRDWYASLMLNRMMFVYFVQKQGFLDDDRDYLRNRLKRVQDQGAGARFQQFYRIFLLRLFHEGLGKPEAQRAPDLAALLGRVPFLNGGLFDVHGLEKDNPRISIPDNAFKRVFDFFDGYRWHLDERPDREDNEINPDVLGYIFEKYVNQKQMGAYYTKEDITGYIGRNTVIPSLFNSVKTECPVALGTDGDVWRLLRHDPDRYIYPAIGHGIAWNALQAGVPNPLDAPFELPDEIAAGIDEVSQRQAWNSPAPEDYALPTETWREVVARRKRYAEVRAKLASGQVQDVNDLITLNLDVERFAKDVIAQSDGPDLLRAFWHAIRDVSILDPTCGSGAFLFAALNILEPLYTACLEGMRGFLDDLERTEPDGNPEVLNDFKDVLAQMETHASERYFVLKSIVLNNLYGVDIIEEAVEICKLRLFLKLVAQLERYDQIEPLPDIDFNIRAGNTLVGFASLGAVRDAMTVTPDRQHRVLFDDDRATLARIEEEAKVANAAFNRFREQQTAVGGEVTAKDKADLRRRLESLGDELDRYLATECSVNSRKPAAYDAWRTSHQPFHWFIEFYGIMQQGGFDVIIGNPPYVVYPSRNVPYNVDGLRYQTLSTKNLYGLVFERSISLARPASPVGLIVQLTSLSSEKLPSLQRLLLKRGLLHASSFPRRPQSIFEGVEMPVSILLSTPAPEQQLFTTNIRRFYADEKAGYLSGITAVRLKAL